MTNARWKRRNVMTIAGTVAAILVLRHSAVVEGANPKSLCWRTDASKTVRYADETSLLILPPPDEPPPPPPPGEGSSSDWSSDKSAGRFLFESSHNVQRF